MIQARSQAVIDGLTQLPTDMIQEVMSRLSPATCLDTMEHNDELKAIGLYVIEKKSKTEAGYLMVSVLDNNVEACREALKGGGLAAFRRTDNCVCHPAVETLLPDDNEANLVAGEPANYDSDIEMVEVLEPQPQNLAHEVEDMESEGEEEEEEDEVVNQNSDDHFFEKVDDFMAHDPLAVAVTRGHRDIVNLLLPEYSLPGDTIAMQNLYTDLLYEAMESRHYGVCDLLIQAGVDVNGLPPSQLCTPILNAVRQGDDIAVDLLLKTNNIEEDSLYDALVYAMELSDLHTVEQLLSYGAPRPGTQNICYWHVVKTKNGLILDRIFDEKFFEDFDDMADTCSRLLRRLIRRGADVDMIEFLLKWNPKLLKKARDNCEKDLFAVVDEDSVYKDGVVDIVRLLKRRGWKGRDEELFFNIWPTRKRRRTVHFDAGGDAGSDDDGEENDSE